ncbi:DEAD/DEAH box helicase [Frankia sp. R43]|uniref:DEAD/DEAH box helicase n=1 Tax=Frankia sp. R43 TaxID=269536 RepID=UPI0006CA02B1|nr:DEAD/DEAH box helicase [Frankia sp. R43]
MSAAHLALRPYQREAIDAVRKAWEGGTNRPAIILPTGAGKTVVASHLIEEETAREGGRTLFLAHREELVDQAAEKIRAVTSGLRVGIEMANRKADLSCGVVVGSVPTLASGRRIAKWPRDAFERVIVDECHHAAARTYGGVLDHFGCFREVGGTNTLGITATLARGDGVGLGGVWQAVAYERSVLEMIVEGFLVNPRGRRVEVDIDFSQVRTKGGDYVASELGEALTEAGFEQEVVEAYQRHGGGRPGLVFAPTVATAQSVAEALCAAGVKAEAVWGEMDRDARAKAIEGLRNGDLDILTNCAVLTEGTDIPRAEVAIMARPTKSGVLYRQMVGRVLRPFPGKANALILDIVGMTTDHRLCTLLDLADGEIKEKPKAKPEEDEQQELFDGEDLVGAVERISRAKVRKVSAVDVNLFASTSKVTWLQTKAGVWFIPAGDGQVFVRESSFKPGTWAIGGMPRTGDPVPFGSAPDLTLAMALGEEHAARVERKAGSRFARKGTRWRDREPGTEQLQAAERWGVHPPPGASAGEVSDLISIAIATARIDGHFARQAARPLRLPTRPGQQAPRVPVRTAG